MSQRLSLLGISLILFGIACRVIFIGYYIGPINSLLSLVMPYIGVVISVVAFFFKEEKK